MDLEGEGLIDRMQRVISPAKSQSLPPHVILNQRSGSAAPVKDLFCRMADSAID